MDRRIGDTRDVHGGAVKVTPKQCPDLYAKLEIACKTLGVEQPEMFVQQNPIVNAFTGGVKSRSSYFTRHLSNGSMTRRLLRSYSHEVRAHPLGTCSVYHAARLIEFLLNRSVAALLPGATRSCQADSRTISAAIASTVARARRAELKLRDRSALLVTQDPHVIRPHDDEARPAARLHISRSTTDLFLDQGRQFKKNLR